MRLIFGISFETNGLPATKRPRVAPMVASRVVLAHFNAVFFGGTMKPQSSGDLGRR
jgi:hypothetical protein